MNHSDDEIFGRNIDQLDRETPRYDLSEEEGQSSTDDQIEITEDELNSDQNKMPSTPPKSTPSVASVQPYARNLSHRTPQVFSPDPVKKSISKDNENSHQIATTPRLLPSQVPSQHSSTSPHSQQPHQGVLHTIPLTQKPTYLKQEYPPNNQYHRRLPVQQNLYQVVGNYQKNLKPESAMAQQFLPKHSQVNNPSSSYDQKYMKHSNISNQHSGKPMKISAQPLASPGQPLLASKQSLGPSAEQIFPCYCLDCMESSIPANNNKQPVLSQQKMVIKPERKKIEDEVLLRQRELDSCWQEDELDCPRDFTAIDRKKEKYYAEWSSEASSGHSSQINNNGVNVEVKASASCTSAQSTVVSRDHPTTTNIPSTYLTNIKTKAKAVVMPFPRPQGCQKKVNINTAVNKFFIQNETEETDETKNLADQWPQSELGSRIPSSERINLSPLCMSSVPSGIQTPSESNTDQQLVEQETQLQLKQELKLPEADLDNIDPQYQFCENDEYKNTYDMPIEPSVDSIKGIQTPEESQDSTAINLSMNAQLNQPETETNITKESLHTPEIKKCVLLPQEHPTDDNITDFSIIPQSELTSRVPSLERIDLSPLCQSEIQSRCQSADLEHQPMINKNGVKLRVRKTRNGANNLEKIETLVDRMNIGSELPAVPRFDYMEQDSVKNYGQPELTSRIQSYENLSFLPWSTNSSGIVTPCDHSSLNIGIKLLPQQEKNEAKIKKLYEIQNRRPPVSPILHQPNHHAICQKHQQIDKHEPCMTSKINNQKKQKGAHIRNASVDNSIDGVMPVDERNQMKHQKLNITHSTSSNDMIRCESYSSIGSTSSNHTDISTVVNASASMHNTAPASPDPDGSEASDSDIMDNDNIDTNTDLPPSYSEPYSPSLSNEDSVNGKRHNLPYKPILRNRNQQCLNDPTGNKIMNENSSNQQSDKDMKNALTNPVKTLIEMAKEQFPKKVPANQQTWSKEVMPMDNLAHQNSVHRYSSLNTNPRLFDPQPSIQQTTPFIQTPHQNINSQRFNIAASQKHSFEKPKYNNIYLKNMQPDFNTNEMTYPSDSVLDPRYQQTDETRFSAMDRPPINNFFHPQSFECGPMVWGHPMQSIPEGQQAQIFQKQNQNFPHFFNNYRLHQGMRPSSAYPQRRCNLVEPNQNSFNNADPLQDFENYKQQPNHVHSIVPDQFKYLQPFQPSAPQKNISKPPHTAGNLANHQANHTRQKLPLAYSATSLEPNHDSPPHSESLETASIISFASMETSNQNTTKADMMSSLLSMLGTHDPDDMARTLLSLSNSPDSCAAMRQSGCLPLIVDLLHNNKNETINWGARQRARLALHNIVHSNGTDRRSKREIRVLRYLDIVRTHIEAILSQKDDNYHQILMAPPSLKGYGTGPAVAAIMRLSFEEEHKNIISELGGLQTLCEVLAVDFMENNACQDLYSIALRRCAGTALQNLTFNDSKNKSVLCVMSNTLQAITGQLQMTDVEDVVQVFAGIIRNISWQPDDKTQKALQKVNATRALLIAVQKSETEFCIRTVLSAVWNLSAHSENKEEVCRTPGALRYLCRALNYRSPSYSYDVVQNAGGILRNVSSHIAKNIEYRKTLRDEGCLQTLVTQLRSPSIRVISNSCDVLWNLSSRCVEDQQLLWDLGAVSILKTLIQVKHESISRGAASALRNLLAVMPGSGTDTESSVSFYQRTNSLPTRDRKNRAGKKTRSLGPAERKKAKSKLVQGNDTRQHISPPTRIDCLNTNQERNDPMSLNIDLKAVHDRHPSSSSRVFFPTNNANFFHNSSCSSFSTNGDPLPGQAKFEYSVASSEDNYSSMEGMEEQILPTDTLYPKLNNMYDRNKDHFNTRKNKTEFEFKSYDTFKDAIISKTKDSVLMYSGSPKLKGKSKKGKKQRVTQPRLSKTQRIKNSLDSVFTSSNSLSNVMERSTAADKPTTREESKTKLRIVNKSHFSDNAYDKKNSNNLNPKSSFEMSSFPDRVASDQCLTYTEKFVRDNLHQPAGGEMYNGSWSTLDVNNEESLSYNQKEDNFTPNYKHGKNIMEAKKRIQPLNNPKENTSVSNSNHQQMVETVFNYQKQPMNHQVPSALYSHQTQQLIFNDQTANKKSGKLKNLLKNPLKKSSDIKMKRK